jgi:hypothetical protein
MGGARTKDSKNIMTNEGVKEHRRFGRGSQNITKKTETKTEDTENATKPRTTATLGMKRRWSILSKWQRVPQPPKRQKEK